MGTTTKMAIPYPEATGLVKDGWEDMKDIATQIDAKSGLVLLNTTSFTGVASTSLTQGIFNSSYRNYFIRIQFTGATASGSLTFRFRTTGTDNSNANYQKQELSSSSTTVTGARSTNQTSFTISSLQTDFNIADIYLYNPQIVSNTGFQIFTAIVPATTGALTDHQVGGFNATTQFDAMSFISTGANITGYYQVYGYND